MPLDGLTLHFMAQELNEKLAGGRVDRVMQPEKDTLILLLRADNANHRLLLCASPNNPRCHLTAASFPNPLEPPMFCMLLRKHLLGARLQRVTQQQGDRVLHFDFDAIDELGDHVLRRLIIEIMSRHSNLILVDGEGRILEAARHVSGDMSRVRQILPGLPYEAPPAQDKADPWTCGEEELLRRLQEAGGLPLKKILSQQAAGLSGAAAEEIAYRLLPPGEETVPAEDLPDCARRLRELFDRMPGMAEPRVLLDDAGDAADMFAFPYLSRDLDRQRRCQTLSAAVEQCYSGRDAKDRIRQKSASMVKLLKGQVERCERKLALQEEELASAERMEEYRVMGELINANLYQLRKGQTEALLDNFYDAAQKPLKVALDIRLTPAQNAQRYFKKYQKARAARITASEQREKTLRELDYLEGMLLDVDKCAGESELEEIREELARTGYMKRVTSRREKRALPASKPYRYQSADGIEIHVGKNAVQNERLTQAAKPNELWLHAKDMPGSHVLVRAEGEVPLATLRQAALLAAWYSKGQHSANVPVDYTLRRYVKKPSGSAPGFVIYTNQHTAYITPDEAEVRKIALLDG